MLVIWVHVSMNTIVNTIIIGTWIYLFSFSSKAYRIYRVFSCMYLLYVSCKLLTVVCIHSIEQFLPFFYDNVSTCFLFLRILASPHIYFTKIILSIQWNIDKTCTLKGLYDLIYFHHPLQANENQINPYKNNR